MTMTMGRSWGGIAVNPVDFAGILGVGIPKNHRILKRVAG